MGQLRILSGGNGFHGPCYNLPRDGGSLSGVILGLAVTDASHGHSPHKKVLRLHRLVFDRQT